MRIRIGLGIKFQLNLTMLTFGATFAPKKSVSDLKQKK